MELSMISGLLRTLRRPRAALDFASSAESSGRGCGAFAKTAPRQFRLFKWFAVASFGAVMLVSAGFAGLLSHFVGEAILRHDALLTSEFVVHLAEAEVLHNGMAGQVTVGQLLNPHFDAAQLNLPPDRVSMVKSEFLTHVALLPDVALVGVYARNRELVWSTASGLLHLDPRAEANIERAFSDKVVSINHSFSPAGGQVRFTEPGKDEYYVEDFIPLLDTHGEVAAVVQVFKRPKSLEKTLAGGKALVWALALFSGAVLFLSLIWIARRGERMIDAQHRRRVEDENLIVIGEMSAAVAHGIRSPLAAIRTSAELSLDGDNASLKKNLESIIRQADRLGRWLKELLIYAGPIDAYADESVDLSAVLHECLAGMRTQLDKQRVSVVLTQRAGAAPLVAANRAVVGQLVHTMLANALEAMPRGGMLRVTVDGAFGRLPLRLVVEDSGAGMTAEQLAQVFRPFSSTKSSGLGIGLPMARRIVERLGGGISFVSRPGAGTRAEISFGLGERGAGASVAERQGDTPQTRGAG